MAEETKPAENAPATGTQPATGTDTKPTETAPATGTSGETKPAEGSTDKPAEGGSQIKNASLEFMSHQCGVLVIMKGGHMVDNSAWQKVEQLNVECETAGQGDAYGDCTSPGNYASMSSCEIGHGQKIEEITQNFKASDKIPGTDWTWGEWGSSMPQAAGSLSKAQVTSNMVFAAQQLKKVIDAVGIKSKDVKITSALRPKDLDSRHSTGLVADVRLRNPADHHKFFHEIYKMHRTGKLCGNQFIWETIARMGKFGANAKNATDLTTSEDNLNSSNAPGSQPVPTACNPSAGSTDSSTSSDSSSTDSSTSTDNSNSGSTDTKPTETKPTTTKPKPSCTLALLDWAKFSSVFIGDDYARAARNARTVYVRDTAKKSKVHMTSFLEATSLSKLEQLAGGQYTNKVVFISSMAIPAAIAGVSVADYKNRMTALIKKIRKTANWVVVLGSNRYDGMPDSKSSTSQGLHSKFKPYHDAIGQLVTNLDRVTFTGNVSISSAAKLYGTGLPSAVSGLFSSVGHSWYNISTKYQPKEYARAECNFKTS